MEMDNSVLMHIMNTQTQMLQKIQETQTQMSLSSMNQNIGSIQTDPTTMSSASVVTSTPAPTMQSEPQVFNANQYYAEMTPAQAVDPTQYGTYAPQANSMASSPLTNISASGTVARMTGISGGLIGHSVTDFADFDPTRHSKESAAEFFAMQTRDMQNKALDATGAVAGAASTVGSFFLPGGLVTSMALGAAAGGAITGVTRSMTEGANVANEYQDILRRDGYRIFNAFESTTEFGGIGVSLDQRQDMSKFLRELAPEKFLEDQEMQQILTGSLDNKLLRSVTDTEKFKEKFTQIVDAVKQITITMNQSIEEATAFMGELERRGISTKDMAFVSGQTKVLSSLWGVDASKGAEQLLGTVDSVVQGTSMNAQNVFNSTSYTSFLGTVAEEQYKAEGSTMYNYIKNNGGIAQVTGGVEQKLRGFTQTEQGKDYLIGFLGSAFEKQGDEFVINGQKLDSLMSGDYSAKQLQDMSYQMLNSLNEGDQSKLMASAASVWNNSADGDDMLKFLNVIGKVFENETGVSDRSVAYQELGIASTYEESLLLQDLGELNQNPEYMKMMTSRALKEEMDANHMASSPSLTDRFKYAWRRNVTDRFGNAGQYISDEIGDLSQDYQQFLTGVGDRSVVGGTMLNDFTVNSVRKEMLGSDGGVARINDYLSDYQKQFQQDVKKDDVSLGDINAAGNAKLGMIDVDSLKLDVEGGFSTGNLKMWLDKLNKEQTTASDLRRLQDLYDSGDLSGADSQRLRYVLDKANGEYDGLLGNAKQALDRTNLAAVNVASDSDLLSSFGSMEKFKEYWGGAIKGGPKDTAEALESIQGDLEKEGKGLYKKLQKTFKQEDLGVDSGEYELLETYIMSGQTDKVRELTGNSSAIDLAQQYEEFRGRETKHAGALKDLTNLGRQTEGVARLGQGVADLVKSTGAFEGDEEEIQSLFGDYIGKSEGMLKKIKKGDLSVEEMGRLQAEMISEGESIFKTMSQRDLTEIATSLQSKVPELKMEELFYEGTNVIDGTELFSAIANDIIKPQQATESDKKVVKGEGSNLAELSRSTDGHTKAITEMVDTFVKETKMLKEAAENMKSGNYSSSYTSFR